MPRPSPRKFSKYREQSDSPERAESRRKKSSIDRSMPTNTDEAAQK